MTTLPTRRQVDAAPPLDFPDRKPAEKDVSITIEVAPDGLHVRCDYVGSLASIPQAIERLRSAGILDLVRGCAPAATAPQGKSTKAQKVTPAYDDQGNEICPTHGTVLRDGRWGKYCPTKDKATGEYCKLKFEA